MSNLQFSQSWAERASSGGTVALPHSLEAHAANASGLAQRIRITLTGFSTPVALEHAYADVKAAQGELAATLAEMEAFLHADAPLAA